MSRFTFAMEWDPEIIGGRPRWSSYKDCNPSNYPEAVCASLFVRAVTLLSSVRDDGQLPQHSLDAFAPEQELEYLGLEEVRLGLCLLRVRS